MTLACWMRNLPAAGTEGHVPAVVKEVISGLPHTQAASLEAIVSFRAKNRYPNINEIHPHLGITLQAACQGGLTRSGEIVIGASLQV